MDRRDFLKKLASVSAAGFLLSNSSVMIEKEAKLPNFVLILADDQGWNALSTRMDPDEPGSGSTYYQTPRLAKLASEGFRFSRAYSPAPTCSPTRHSIQYGRSPSSLGIFAGGSGGFEAESTDALANVLKKARPEYATAHLGKWHQNHSPDELGYDVNDGETGNADGNDASDPDDPKKIFSLSRRGNEFMEAQVQAGRPFFLQISHYADHLAYRALQETIDEYENEHAGNATEYQNSPLWAAMNENLDTGVGMVLDKIEELGIADDTYVIYTGDNGYESKVDQWVPVVERTFNKAYPLLSHKYMINEGGLRVPFIVRGPGIEAGASSRKPVIGYDIFPTIMDIVGHSDQLPEVVEGGSLLALLRSGGKANVTRKDPFFVFRYTKVNGALDIAIVQGDYKLLKEIEHGNLHLWNLSEDLGEQENLIDQQPERAQKMYDAMTEYFARVGWDESQAGA
jgi:arylsulfatase A-like enzyme